MIERILENWLTKASERSYQLPFCFLLVQQGKTIVHLTRHCAMEHGKDVIATDVNGTAHVYQLKGVSGGRIKISDWQGMLGQLTQMVLTPVTHPSVNSTQYHISYLVINGDIDEEVQSAITSFNLDWEKKGFPQYKINTIVKGELLTMALENKEWFFPSEIKDIKSVLEFFLQDGKGCLEKGQLSEILYNHLDPYNIKSAAEFKRKATSGALLCSLCTTAYSNEANHVAVSEAWMVYIVNLFRATELSGRELKDIKDELSIAKEIIFGSIANIVEEVQPLDNFLMSDTLRDGFTFGHRTTIVLGMIAWLGLADPDADIDAINGIIHKNLKYMTVWGESALPYLLAIYFYHDKHIKIVKSEEVIGVFLTTIVQQIFSPTSLFTDVYTTTEMTISSLFSTEEQEHHSPRISYTLYPFLLFAAKEGCRRFVEALWPKISECIFLEIKMQSLTDLYSWRVREAEEVATHPELTQSWAELLKKAEDFDSSKVPTALVENVDLLPLFWMVFPHRLTPDLAKFAKNHFTVEKLG